MIFASQKMWHTSLQTFQPNLLLLLHTMQSMKRLEGKTVKSTQTPLYCNNIPVVRWGQVVAAVIQRHMSTDPHLLQMLLSMKIFQGQEHSTSSFSIQTLCFSGGILGPLNTSDPDTTENVAYEHRTKPAVSAVYEDISRSEKLYCQH